MPKPNHNSISLAGEFAVLAQLALRGYDANLTLGRTKSVDILVSDPVSGRMLKLEVKTTCRSSRGAGSASRLFGKCVSEWVMGEKHESIRDPALFYCFVNISEDTKQFRYFIVPSAVVAEYIIAQHQFWLNDKPSRSDNSIRMFRIGSKEYEPYPIPMPLAEQYEDD
jgi:hypothetical protein